MYGILKMLVMSCLKKKKKRRGGGRQHNIVSEPLECTYPVWPTLVTLHTACTIKLSNIPQLLATMDNCSSV